MSNIRKVALFFLGLDLKTADLLMQRLDRQVAHAVRREMLAIQDASPQDVANVSKEFVRDVHRSVYQGKIPAALLQASHETPTPNTAPHDAGVYTRPQPKRVTSSHFDTAEFSNEFSTSAHVVCPPSVPAITEPKSPTTSSPPLLTGDATASDGGDLTSHLALLETMETSVLAEVLASESVQTLALVLAHVETDVAREILSTFPKEQQAEVMRRLSLLEEIDADTVRVVASTLAHRMAALTQQRSGVSRGLSSARQLLAALDVSTRDEILHAIAHHDTGSGATSTMSHTAATPPVSATDPIVVELESLDDDAITTLVRRVDPCAVMVAIAGAPSTLIDRFLKNYSPMEQTYIADQLQRFTPIEPQDIDVARLVLGGELRTLRHERKETKNAKTRFVPELV